MSIKKQVDVLVIGAGPSGTIAASLMHKAGLSVQVVEKMKFPRFVIGESLLPRCMEALEEAGLLDAVKEKHFQQKDGAKFVFGDKDCDFNFSQQFTPGWKWTWQVPRADFDKTLADECEKMGVSLEYETEVTNIEIAADGSSKTTIKDKEGNTNVIEARFIVDGSGYGRVIPRLFGLEKQSSLPPRKTLFCHMTDPKRSAAFEPNRIIIYVHNPRTWIWVIPFANGNTSVGYVGSPEFFEAFEGTPEQQFRQLLNAQPELAERFGDSEMLWEPRTLQSWSVTTESFYGNGFVLTGNVTEFLDPVFSSGVTLASVSAQMAAKLVIKHLQGGQVDWQSEYMDPMMKGVDVFRTYVNGWYDGTLFTIFFAENRNPEIMSQICSVLAGYVWDENNPFVRSHEKNVRTLARYLETTKTTV
ncbi:MAG: pyridine nucleotide-disulfide oxidoreductase [Bacteroidetes bacterium 46-16]|nr:MAG: pyridine nucleotide-disulfide oxidoreductase [Bacteroidetes bacterium 46-16]